MIQKNIALLGGIKIWDKTEGMSPKVSQIQTRVRHPEMRLNRYHQMLLFNGMWKLKKKKRAYQILQENSTIFDGTFVQYKTSRMLKGYNKVAFILTIAIIYVLKVAASRNTMLRIPTQAY